MAQAKKDEGSAVGGFFADPPDASRDYPKDVVNKAKENSRKMARATAQKAGAYEKTSKKRGSKR